MNTPQERKVGILFGIGIFFLPIIFAWIVVRQGYSTLARVLSFAWLAFFILIVVLPNPSKTVNSGKSDSIASITATTPAATSASTHQFNTLEDLHQLPQWPSGDAIDCVDKLKSAENDQKDFAGIILSLRCLPDVFQTWPDYRRIFPPQVASSDPGALSQQLEHMSPLEAQSGNATSQASSIITAVTQSVQNKEFLYNESDVRMPNYDLDEEAFVFPHSSYFFYDIDKSNELESKTLELNDQSDQLALIKISDKAQALKLEKIGKPVLIARFEWVSETGYNDLTHENQTVTLGRPILTHIYIVDKNTNLIIWPYQGVAPIAPTQQLQTRQSETQADTRPAQAISNADSETAGVPIQSDLAATKADSYADGQVQTNQIEFTSAELNTPPCQSLGDAIQRVSNHNQETLKYVTNKFITVKRSCEADSSEFGHGKWGWSNGGWRVQFSSCYVAHPRETHPFDDGVFNDCHLP